MRLVPCWVVISLLLASAAPVSAENAPKGRKKPAVSKGTADKDTLKLVEYFLKSETGDLDFSLVPRFMGVDAKTLPGKLRAPFQAKKTELNVLKKLSANKKKPPIRRASVETRPACDPEEGDMKYVNALRGMGFEQLYEDEVQHLMKVTRCTECELHEESSLMSIVVLSDQKGPEGQKQKASATRFLFISKSDPWMAIVAQFRSGKSGGTDFFGSFYGACH